MLEDIDKIQKYKAGLLSDEEKNAFEKRMHENQVLKKMVVEYDQYSVIADAIIEDDIITSINKERKYLSRKNTITAIGSIILLLTLLFLSYKFLIPSGNSVPYADLYEQYYSPPMGNMTRSENGTAVVLKSCDLGHELLDERKYEEALAQFTTALNDPETRCREKAEFYSALIYLRNKDLRKAVEHLTVISENPDHSFFSKGTQLLNEIQPGQ